MKKPYLERVITADGFGPLLFYLMLGVAALMAGYILHLWVAFGMHLHLLPGV